MPFSKSKNASRVDVPFGQFLPNSPRARVEHEPYVLVLIKAEFNDVPAGITPRAAPNLDVELDDVKAGVDEFMAGNGPMLLDSQVSAC